MAMEQVSFIALVNKKGIACASDTKMSLYTLSGSNADNEIVCIAVNALSEMPWNDAIYGFRKNGGFSNHDCTDFMTYVNMFFNYIHDSGYRSKENENCLFLGFCKDDVFPVVMETTTNQDFRVMSNNTHIIDHDYDTAMVTLGDFDSMEPFLYGMTTDMQNAYRLGVADAEVTVKERVTGTEQEIYITEGLKRMNHKEIIDCIKKDHEARFRQALDSFNIEDMTHTSEMFLNFNAQFRRLNGKTKNLRTTEEMAVITRTEGLKWIKHCLFG